MGSRVNKYRPRNHVKGISKFYPITFGKLHLYLFLIACIAISLWVNFSLHRNLALDSLYNGFNFEHLKLLMSVQNIFSRSSKYRLIVLDDAVYFVDNDKLLPVSSCFLCGDSFNLCNGEWTTNVSTQEVDLAVQFDRLSSRVGLKISKEQFNCSMMIHILDLLPTETYLWSEDRESDLFIISSQKEVSVVGRCDTCSPLFATSMCVNPNPLLISTESTFLTVASQNNIDSYPKSSDLGYTCAFLDLWKAKFLLARNKVFLAVKEHQAGEGEKFYFLFEKILYLVPGCTPCSPNPMTLCPTLETKEINIVPFLHVTNDQIFMSNLTIHEQPFRCEMFGPMKIQARAALHTPYHITPGGGEKYLLESLVLFQSIGYFVDIYAKSDNVCKSKDCILNVGTAVHAQIKPEHMNYYLHDGNKKQLFLDTLESFGYEIFFLLGNEKIPQSKGIGKYNVYQCQFPFDLDRGEVDESNLKAIASYDAVWVNSQFTRSWYLKYSHPWMSILMDNSLNWIADNRTPGPNDQWRLRRWPSVITLNPPVHVYESNDKKDDCSLIVLLGRVFQGRQSKGHAAAIEMVVQMRQQYPLACFNLALAGFVMPGMAHYADALRSMASVHGFEIHFDANVEVLHTLLSRARVQWHLTGGFNDDSDPGSMEHFGIAIVEGMSKGAIPLVLNRGGPAEIVTPECGRVLDNINSFIPATAEILMMDPSERNLLSSNAKERAKLYSEQSFSKEGSKHLQRGKMEQMYLKMLDELKYKTYERSVTPASSRKCSTNGTCAALIVEFREHSSLGFALMNAKLHLGDKWKFYVLTRFESAPFIQRVISSVFPDNVLSLDPLDTNKILSRYSYSLSPSFNIELWTWNSPITMNTDLYTALFKREDFWDIFSLHYGMMVYQVDSVFVRDPEYSIEHYIDYDYVGAPWCEDNDILMPLRAAGTIKYLVGNGGFSWRTIRSMNKCVREMAAESPPSEPEDRFFIRCFSAFYGEYNVASVEVARTFAVEVPCWEFDKAIKQGKRPLGLHATWYYAQESTIRSSLQLS